jgi:hypothetical protein
MQYRLIFLISIIFLLYLAQELYDRANKLQNNKKQSIPRIGSCGLSDFSMRTVYQEQNYFLKKSKVWRELPMVELFLES